MDLKGLLQLMIDRKASDLHVRSSGPPYMRVNGVIAKATEEINSPDEVAGMLNSIVSPYARKLFDLHGECDFSFQFNGAARYRVNAFKQRQSLCLALRAISSKIPTLEELHLPVEPLRKISAEARGLILVTGITGTGKSSTLAAMIDCMNETRASHILTIEDPVEFLFKDKKCLISQREIGEDTETYSEGLRMAMRQNPDIIMVGEMRDLETIGAALTAAQTGHLVVGTLHTIDAIHTISRIVDIYPAHQQPLIRRQLSESLKAVISQRLLACIQGGRIPAVEILVVTALVRKLIEENNSLGISQACAKGQYYGMQTFNQSLVQLCKAGLVKEEDVMEAATSPDDVRLALRGIEQEAGRG